METIILLLVGVYLMAKTFAFLSESRCKELENKIEQLEKQKYQQYLTYQERIATLNEVLEQRNKQ